MAHPSADDERVEMPSGATPTSAAVLQQIALVLHPMVKLLLAHGVAYPQLAETLKGIFVEVAQRETEPGARRMTDSKLAVTTGIHRKDIKRLRAAEVQPVPGVSIGNAPANLTSAVVTRWLSNPGYCDKDGIPKTLHRRGDKAPSFEMLVKSISTDVHSRTVLNELNRLDLIEASNDSIRLRVDAFVPKSDFAQMLGYMGANLHDHAAAAVRNMLGTQPAFLEQSIYSEAIHADAIDELAVLARQHWTHILKEFVPQVARHEPDESGAKEEVRNPTQRARIRIGMYFYAEDACPTAQLNLHSDPIRKQNEND
jgi:hypothetical protein